MVDLNAFRDELRRQGLNAFLVPMDDAHMGEYSPGSERRITALSGFLGSAGFAVVTLDKALIWTDSRYTIAIRLEVDEAVWTIGEIETGGPLASVSGFLKAGEALGYDPRMHTIGGVEFWSQAVAKVKASLKPVSSNPVDVVWRDQPAPPATPVVPHGLEYSGLASVDKRRTLAASLSKEGLSAQVINQSDSVAWLLNARADDIAGLPVPRSFATLHADGSVDWFIQPERITDAMHQALDNRVAIFPPEEMSARLGQLSGRVGLDRTSCNAAIGETLRAAGAEVVANPDPVVLPRAIKNETEQQGARDAQRRDARAMIRFSRWLAEHPAIEQESELSVAAALLGFREQNPDPVPMHGISFNTISAFAGHAAIAHYAVSEETSLPLAKGQMLLVDSGGQYHNGTTDITRVWAIGGQATDRQRRDYSLTLKGHLALARQAFPTGTMGHHLDALTRQFMWAEGIDFQHGTGHGIGSYLSVHEGPQTISKRPSKAALHAGMLLSNEPGIYREGESGVRIENVELVVTRADGFLAFETLTLVPYDRNLIDLSLLTPEEIAQIDAYHARVLAEVGPDLDGADLDHLRQTTEPLA